MKETSPKRYAHSLIRHFVIFSLFMPTFFSQYDNAYYQDIFFGIFLAAFFIINILQHWKLDFRKNTACAITLTSLLVLYNAAAFYNYHTNKGLVFWYAYQINVTIAFLFFIIMLLLKDINCVLSDKVIKWTVRACILHNLVGYIFRALGYCRIHMMNLKIEMIPMDPANKYFSWMYSEASEYALLLLLEIGLFMVYKDLFINRWTYIVSQGILIIGLLLTNSVTFLLAAAFLFGGQLIQYLIDKFRISKKYILLSIPAAAILVTGFFLVLFTKVDTFHTKFLIWKGHWEMLLEDPVGQVTAFGPLRYYVPGVNDPVNQAHNIFLNHMLRYSLTVGLLYAGMFLAIVIFAIRKKPGYLTAGLWIGLLLPMNMNYSLQTLNLPFALFMIYCIFFREKNSVSNTAPSETEITKSEAAESNNTESNIPDLDFPELVILDLDETDIK